MATVLRAVRLQYFSGTSAALLQSFCSPSAVLLRYFQRYFCGTFSGTSAVLSAVLQRYFCGTRAVRLQYVSGTSAVLLRYFCSASAVQFRCKPQGSPGRRFFRASSAAARLGTILGAFCLRGSTVLPPHTTKTKKIGRCAGLWEDNSLVLSIHRKSHFSSRMQHFCSQQH